MITTIEHPKPKLLHISLEWISDTDDYAAIADKLIQEHLPNTQITDPRVQYAKFLRYVEVENNKGLRSYALNSCLSVIVDNMPSM